ncbi:hypothetical protein DL96DRAFT_1818988 [Flagelloscypha sp. PMI_526]|nr:hypothetical protein DL96DRAFT_1818988 [Flagelloscypha sp. PMI_526]
MAPKIPVDLHHTILLYLSRVHLYSCSLVSAHFCQISRRLLFSRLSFSHAIQLEERCRFFLSSRGDDLWKYTQKLTIGEEVLVIDSPVLCELLLHASSSIRRLKLKNHPDGGYSKKMNQNLLLSLHSMIFPNIHSLSIHFIDDTHLHEVLTKCPKLKSLDLPGFTPITITMNPAADKHVCQRLPRLESLRLAQFSGFAGCVDTAKCGDSLRTAVQTVQTLHIGKYLGAVNDLFGIIFKGFGRMKCSLLHLSLSIAWYESWITSSTQVNQPGYLPLHELEKLESLTFHLEFPRDAENWSTFFNWLAKHLVHRSPALSDPGTSSSEVVHSPPFPQSLCNIRLIASHGLLPKSHADRLSKEEAKVSIFPNHFDEVAKLLDPPKMKLSFVLTTPKWSKEVPTSGKVAEFQDHGYAFCMTIIERRLASWKKQKRLEIWREWL